MRAAALIVCCCFAVIAFGVDRIGRSRLATIGVTSNTSDYVRRHAWGVLSRLWSMLPPAVMRRSFARADR